MSKGFSKRRFRFDVPPSASGNRRIQAISGPQIRRDFLPALVLVGWLSNQLDERYLCGDHRPNPPVQLLSRNRLLIKVGRGKRDALAPLENANPISPLRSVYSAHSLELHRHPNFQMKIRDGFTVRQLDLTQICGLQPLVSLMKVRMMMTSLQSASPQAITQLALPLQALPTYVPFASVIGAVMPVFSYVQVVKIGERFLLTDGYHRAVAFLNAGITSIPGLYREAGSVQEAGMGRLGELPQQLLHRRRPPLLTDFFIEGLAVTIDP